MKLKLFKTKDGYSRVKSEELEEISTQNILTEEDTDLKDQDVPEDVPVTPDTEKGTPVTSTEVEEQGVETGILNTLRSLIQDEYEAIDGYNNAYQMLIELDKYENVAEILRHIMLEEYSHVGELQKCLAEIDPEAFQSLDSGEDDAEEILDVEPEAINTNEALEKFYVTTYGPDYTSGPEEGGYTSKGTVVLSSKPMDSLEAAHQYVKKFEDEGIELSETSTSNVWRVENDSIFELIAIETDANRGEYHAPAKTWAEAEMDVEFDKPFFDAEGKVLPEDPAKTAAREEEKKTLEAEFLDKVNSIKSIDDATKLLADVKYDRYDILNNHREKIYDKVLEISKESTSESKEANESKSTKKSKDIYCVYFEQDGYEQLEFTGTSDECNKYISDIQAEQDAEFSDEAPERFIKRLDESKSINEDISDIFANNMEEFCNKLDLEYKWGAGIFYPKWDAYNEFRNMLDAAGAKDIIFYYFQGDNPDKGRGDPDADIYVNVEDEDSYAIVEVNKFPIYKESKSIKESKEEEKVYTKKNGDYLVKGDTSGYQAFSKDNVHLGYIDEEDPQEAQFKFDKNQFTESKESEESELITQYINNGEFDKLEKVKDGTNVTWKLKDTLTESKTVGDFPEDSEAGKWLKALLIDGDLELENLKILDSYIGKNFADFTLNINGDVIKYRVHKGGNVTIKESLKEARRKASDPKQIEKAEKAMFDSLMNGSSNTEWMIQDAKMIFGLSYDEAVKAFRNAHNKFMSESDI